MSSSDAQLRVESLYEMTCLYDLNHACLTLGDEEKREAGGAAYSVKQMGKPPVNGQMPTGLLTSVQD